MASNNAYTVTEEGLQKLKDELEERTTVKRKEIVEAIGTALSFGDISENSEYDEAKDAQAVNEARINELTALIKRAVVVSAKDIKTDKVGVGNKVTVYDKDFDEEAVYTIVGSNEANPAENKISDQSPMGIALIGKAVGEVAGVDTPDGEKIELEVRKIELA